MDEKFCINCGCEIRQKSEVGKIYYTTEAVSRIKKPSIICIDCLEDQEVEFKGFTESEEFELECYFNKLAKEDVIKEEE